MKKIYFFGLIISLLINFSNLNAQQISLSHNFINFGNNDTTALADSVLTVHISNTGNSSLDISGMNVLQNPFSIINTPSLSINPEDSIEISINLNRDILPGFYVDTLFIANNDNDTAIVLNAILTHHADIFSFNDIDFWIGSGSKQAMLIIDWNDGSNNEALAWGYRFDGLKTAENMINEIATIDPLLSFNLGAGFINDIIYETHTGIGGLPYYWSSWSSTNMADWAMNFGISEELSDGEWFACSYTDFMPATLPGLPIGSNDNADTEAFINQNFNVYPNPFTNILRIESDGSTDNEILIYNASGKLVYHKNIKGNEKISLTELPKGIYMLKIINNKSACTKKLIKL